MNDQPAGEIVLYQRGDAPAIVVRLDGDTVWLSLNQIAELLGRDKSTISRHIAKVFAEGELGRQAVVAEIATTAADGKTYRVEHFNLDVIISAYFDFAELNAIEKRAMRMADFVRELDAILTSAGRKVLQDAARSQTYKLKPRPNRKYRNTKGSQEANMYQKHANFLK